MDILSNFRVAYRPDIILWDYFLPIDMKKTRASLQVNYDYEPKQKADSTKISETDRFFCLMAEPAVHVPFLCPCPIPDLLQFRDFRFPFPHDFPSFRPWKHSCQQDFVYLGIRYFNHFYHINLAFYLTPLLARHVQQRAIHYP